MSAADEMIELVIAHERKESEAILGRAQAEAHRLLTDAHRAARAHMHRTVLEIRQMSRRKINQAEAALETARRQHQQRCDFHLIESAWPRLHEELNRRWRDDAGRKRWIDATVEQARAVLPSGEWEIAHPRDWPAAERSALLAQLASDLGATSKAVTSTDISAGLKLCADGTCLDGTLDGILGDRTQIEAMLLAELGTASSQRSAIGNQPKRV